MPKSLLLVMVQLLMTLSMTLAGQGYSTACPGGQIKSPNYPHNYDDNLNLHWTLTAPTDQRIILNFTKLPALECCCDFLKIYAGSTADHEPIATYCSDKEETLIASPGNALFVTFSSDETVSDSGFSATYFCLDCNKYLTNPTGDISSPLYPDNYINDASCSWLIEVPEGNQILLT
ncbi:deleted in malignant brain tumors 1 protein [Biomphalaria glabrata]